MGSAKADLSRRQVTKPKAGVPQSLKKTNDRSAVKTKGKISAKSD